MIRVFRTLDLLEAEIVTQLLRENELDAQLFDVGFVRQDWFGAIAYGGYRVVVQQEDFSGARALLERWQAGEFDIEQVNESIAIDRVVCPSCGSVHTMENPWPRRIRFLVIALLKLPIGGFRWHYRCKDCDCHFRAFPECSHAELARRVDAASAES